MSKEEQQEEMSGKGKRRSARLLKLDEQKNDGDSAVCLLDPWQIIRNSISGSSVRGKRKRNAEIQLQGEASCSHQPLDPGNSNNYLSIQNSAGQIIEYILDELELRDRHELFTMPDDIQVTDYAERVSRPGDFATLRQKNKDGMYTALEQFENDVYMVFQKAISMNSQDTVPFREGMALLDQAKQVFLSLRNNQMYSEWELAAWRQKHLDQLQQPITPARREGDNGGASSRHAVATPVQRAAPKMKGAAEKKQQQQQNARTSGNASENQRARQRGANRESNGTLPGKRTRKAAGTAGVVDAGVVARRRLTYTHEAGADQGRRTTPMPMQMPMPVLQGRHVALQNQPQEHTYRGSLQRFVRHAGLKARVAAEFRSLECVARARHSSAPHYWSPPGAGAGCFLPHGYRHPAQPSPPGAADDPALPAPPPSAGQARPPECKLETDEVLKLFVLMGTPAAFLERAKQMFGDERRAVKAADDDARAGATVAKAADAAADPGQKTSASEPAAGAFGPFAPPKLVPGPLGFGQFAGSSAQPFKVKPSTSNASGKKKIS